MNKYIETQTQLLIEDVNEAIETFFSRDPLTEKLIPVFKENFQMAMDDHVPYTLEQLEGKGFTDEQKWQHIEAETPIWGIDSQDAFDSGFINDADVDGFIERYGIPQSFLNEHGDFYAIDHVTITYYDALLRDLLKDRPTRVEQSKMKELASSVEENTVIEW